MIRWLRSLLFRPKLRIVPGRTRDSVIRNRKFNMPLVWHNFTHLQMWCDFLEDRMRAGNITRAKYLNKIRAACNNYNEQRRQYGSLPGDGKHDPAYLRELARSILQKADV